VGFWSLLTGADTANKTLDIADKTTTGIINGLDKMFYTKEEKAQTLTKRLEIAEKMSQTHIKLMEATHNETTARSITRRITAIFIMFLTLLSIITICITYKLDPDFAKFQLEVVKYFQIGWAFIGVVIFFFGNHMINGLKK